MAEAGRDLQEHRGRAQRSVPGERDHQHQQVADLEERMAAARSRRETGRKPSYAKQKNSSGRGRARAGPLEDKLDKARAGLDLEGTTKSAGSRSSALVSAGAK